MDMLCARHQPVVLGEDEGGLFVLGFDAILAVELDDVAVNHVPAAVDDVHDLPGHDGQRGRASRVPLVCCSIFDREEVACLRQDHAWRDGAGFVNDAFRQTVMHPRLDWRIIAEAGVRACDGGPIDKQTRLLRVSRENAAGDWSYDGTTPMDAAFACLPRTKAEGQERLLHQLHPLVLPQVLHFMQVPLRTRVKLPQLPQASPS